MSAEFMTKLKKDQFMLLMKNYISGIECLGEMMRFVSALFNVFFKIPEKLRYLLVGGFNTVIGYCVFVFLGFFFDKILHYNAILLIQYIITVSISYINMKYFVFRSKGSHGREYVKVCFTYVATYFLNAFFLYLSQLARIDLYLSQAIVLVVITIIIYLMHKNINYK